MTHTESPAQGPQTPTPGHPQNKQHSQDFISPSSQRLARLVVTMVPNGPCGRIGHVGEVVPLGTMTETKKLILINPKSFRCASATQHLMPASVSKLSTTLPWAENKQGGETKSRPLKAHKLTPHGHTSWPRHPRGGTDSP